MKRFIIPAALVLFTTAAIAQTAPAAAQTRTTTTSSTSQNATPATSTTTTTTTTTTTASPVVAVVNGEVITRAQLDHMWERIGPQMQEAYSKSGGKGAFLENYLRKRLIVQEAIKHNFPQRPDVQQDMELAKESALFDRYIKDEIASSVISESDLINYYNDHKAEFAVPEAVHARHIIIMPGGAHAHSRQEADALMSKIAADLAAATKGVTDPAMARAALRNRFMEEAKLYSEDASAKDGGDLGWVTRGAMDPTFEQAAFSLSEGSVSPVVETRYGLHMIFLEGKRSGGLQPFDAVRQQVRDRVIQLRQAEIMGEVSKLTNELRNSGNVKVMRENID